MTLLPFMERIQANILLRVGVESLMGAVVPNSRRACIHCGDSYGVNFILFCRSKDCSGTM